MPPMTPSAPSKAPLVFCVCLKVDDKSLIEYRPFSEILQKYAKHIQEEFCST